MVEAKTTQQNNTSLVKTSQFTGMAFVGIKKVEYFAKDEESIVFSDILEILENRNYASNLMLGFFSVKPFGIEKVEQIDSILSMNNESNEMLIKQGLKKVALFDFANAAENAAGHLRIIIAADCIIHWDSDGSYIQPMHETSLLNDLEDIVKSYPGNYKITIYTQKDLSAFTAKKFKQKSIFEVPIYSNMWYNQPTFQQVYGNAVLTAGLITLAMAYGLLNWQNGKIEDLRNEISSIRSQQIDESFYSSSNLDLEGLNNSVAYQALASLITKDISNSLSKSGFKVEEIDFIRNIDDKTAVVTIKSQDNTHTQFSVQEPLAQRILENSSTIKAIKKVTSAEQSLILEALVDLDEVRAGFKKANAKGGLN